MAASRWYFYNDFLFNEGKGLIDLSSAALKLCLVDSSSIAINQALAGATYAALVADGHELPTANGYTAGGAAVTQTWTGGGALAISTLVGDAITWIASGAGLTARAAVLYDSASASGQLIAYLLLDSTPADVVVPAGAPLDIVTGTIGNKSRT